MNTNLRTMDVTPVIVIIVARESAFDKSRDQEMSGMSSKEYPVWVKKKKSGKGGWKIIATSDKRKRQMQLVDKDVSGAEERDKPTNNYTVTPFLSMIPCINTLFLLFLFVIF